MIFTGFGVADDGDMLVREFTEWGTEDEFGGIQVSQNLAMIIRQGVIVAVAEESAPEALEASAIRPGMEVRLRQVDDGTDDGYGVLCARDLGTSDEDYWDK